MCLKTGLAKTCIKIFTKGFVPAQDSKTLPSNFQNDGWSIRNDSVAMLTSRDGGHLSKDLANS